LWLALFGAGVWWWRSPVVLGSVLLFGLVPLLFIFAYNSESDTGRYFLAAYFALAAMAGYGAQALTALPAASRMAAASVGAIVVVNALGMDERQMASLFTQPHDVGASAWIDRIRILTPPDAIVGAYVEHRLGARIIVTADPQEYRAKYRGWLRTRPVVVVSDDDETFAGFGQRQIDTGSPHLYALR
jgi:4-amino-4-deoxy-L-arabinose transferase-like glycosyltransferase